MEQYTTSNKKSVLKFSPFSNFTPFFIIFYTLMIFNYHFFLIRFFYFFYFYMIYTNINIFLFLFISLHIKIFLTKNGGVYQLEKFHHCKFWVKTPLAYPIKDSTITFLIFSHGWNQCLAELKPSKSWTINMICIFWPLLHGEMRLPFKTKRIGSISISATSSERKSFSLITKNSLWETI